MEIFTQQFITLVLTVAATVTAITEMLKRALTKAGLNVQGWGSWILSALVAVIPCLQYSQYGFGFEIVLYIVTVLTANGIFLFTKKK